jgi:hypothetical protein
MSRPQAPRTREATPQQAPPAAPPPLAAWDFDHGGCPDDELAHCCFYEYALELPKVRDLVLRWRVNRTDLNQTGDEADKLVQEQWFGSPFRVLVNHPEFPDKHWLEIDPVERRQKLSHLPARSTLYLPNHLPKYAGPQPAHFTRLHAEDLVWQDIEMETEALRGLFWQARKKASLRRWPKQLGRYLEPAEMNDWQQRLSKLSGDALYLAANRLRVECKKRIEQRHRSPFELVVYEIDWTLRPDELVERFRQWAEFNRVHEPRPRTGGHPARAIELLKALGAKRLMDFFQKHQKTLPRPYKVQTLHAALSDYTSDQRKTAGRPAKPLYSNPAGWIDAQKAADRYLKAL